VEVPSFRQQLLNEPFPPGSTGCSLPPALLRKHRRVERPGFAWNIIAPSADVSELDSDEAYTIAPDLTPA